MSKQLFLLVLALSGCAVDAKSNPNYVGCTDDAECEGGHCHRGFCVPGPRLEPPCPMEEHCYDGDPATRNIGSCRAGCQMAEGMDGGTVCVGQTLPNVETCNTFDDDCDGSIDEDFAFDSMTQCGGCGVQCALGDVCCSNGAGGYECANLSASSNHCGECLFRCGESMPNCCGSDRCVNFMTDEMHCGRCDNPCGAAQICCGGRCIDPRSSIEHCSDCGMACMGTDVCCPLTGGGPPGCHPMGMCATCMNCTDANDLCCGGICIDRTIDEANCGTCGHACASSERCCDGNCLPIDSACPDCGSECESTQQCCDGACVSDTDAMNCRGCGVTCNTEAGQVCCGGANGGCVDTQTSPYNCGACGRTCVGGYCSSGICCASDQVNCSGTCVPLNTNAHCGSCTTTCSGILDCNCTPLTGGGYGCRRLGIGGMLTAC